MHFSCFSEQFSKTFFVIKTACFLDQRASWQNIFLVFDKLLFLVLKRGFLTRDFFSAAFSWVPFYQFPELCRKAFFGCFYDGGMWEPLFIKKYRELWRHLKGHLGRGTHHPSKPIYQKRWLLDQLLLFTILYWASGGAR